MNPFRASNKFQKATNAVTVKRFAKRQYRPLRVPVLVRVFDRRVCPLIDGGLARDSRQTATGATLQTFRAWA